MPSNARCGHTHYDKGHCSQPDCPNDIRRCRDCNAPDSSWPSAKRESGNDPFGEDEPGASPWMP